MSFVCSQLLHNVWQTVRPEICIYKTVGGAKSHKRPIFPYIHKYYALMSSYWEVTNSLAIPKSELLVSENRQDRCSPLSTSERILSENTCLLYMKLSFHDPHVVKWLFSLKTAACFGPKRRSRSQELWDGTKIFKLHHRETKTRRWKTIKCFRGLGQPHCLPKNPLWTSDPLYITHVFWSKHFFSFFLSFFAWQLQWAWVHGDCLVWLRTDNHTWYM